MYYYYPVNKKDEKNNFIKFKNKAEAKNEVNSIFSIVDDNCLIYENGLMYICFEAESELDFINKIPKKDGDHIKVSEIKKTIWCSIDDDRIKHKVIGFDENNNNKRNKKVLYLGTHITEKSIDAGLFYKERKNNSEIANLEGNDFWPLLTDVYDVNFNLQISDLIKALKKYNIAIADIIGECYCIGSSDGLIVPGTERKNNYLQKMLDNADVIVFNGKSTYKKYSDLIKKYPNEFKYNINGIIIKIVTSSSGSGLGGRKKVTKDDRKKEWLNVLTELVKNER